MSQSNNFDGPILLDQASAYVGFGRSGFNDFSDFSRLQYSAVNPNGVLSSRIGSLCMTPGGIYWNTDGASAWTLLTSSTNNAEQYCFVWRPGGVAVDNVYTTWAALYAAASLVQGAKLIWLDPSLGTHTMTNGAFDLSQFKFIGASNITPLAPIVDIIVTVNAGVTWTSPFYASHALYWLFETPATVLTVGAGQRFRMELRDRTRFVPGNTGGPSPIILTQGANSRLDMYLDEASSIEQGGSGVTVAVGALGATVIALGDRAQVEGETLGDQGGSGGLMTIDILSPSGSYAYFQPSFTAPGNLTITKESQEANIVWPQNLTSGAINQERGVSVIGIDASLLAGSVQLLAGALWVGERLTIKKSDSSTNTVTILRAGADLIDGSTSLVLDQPYQSVMLHNTGTGVIYTVGDGNSVGLDNVFVWRTGAAHVGNVYSDWTSLYNDAITVSGPKTIWCDDTAGALTFTAGAFDLGEFSFVGFTNRLNGIPTDIIVNAGTVINVPPYLITGSIVWTFAAASTMVIPSNGFYRMAITGDSVMQQVAGATPAITITGGLTIARLEITLEDSVFGASGATQPMLETVDPNGQAAFTLLQGAVIEDNCVDDNGVGSIAFTIKSSSADVSYAQSGLATPLLPAKNPLKQNELYSFLSLSGVNENQTQDVDLYYLNTSLNVMAFNLLPAAQWTNQEIVLKMINSGSPPLAITVTPSGAETIDLAATLVLNTSLACVRLVSDGTNIHVLNQT